MQREVVKKMWEERKRGMKEKLPDDFSVLHSPAELPALG